MSIMEVIGYVSLCLGVIAMIYKGIREIKRPVDDVNDKLENDYKDINGLKEDIQELREELDDLKQGLGICLEAINQLLEHSKTGNNTGGMQKSQDKIFKFLNY